MLTQNTLFGTRDLVQIAIERFKFAYEVSQQRGLGPLYVAFSGGKDSVVIAELARLSGVPYELHYNITGIDPPEVIYFMREHYPQLNWHRPRKTMWQLIVEKKMPPTRLIRYCCSELKEHGGENKVNITGVRWAESTRRKNTRNAYETKVSKVRDKIMAYDDEQGRLTFRSCPTKGGYIVNPIVDWTTADVWEFIRSRNLSYCKLYDQGEIRIGCIGCPMGGPKGMRADFARYPKFKALYLKAFDAMITKYPEKVRNWRTADDVMEWWVGFGDRKKQRQIEGQLIMEVV